MKHLKTLWADHNQHGSFCYFCLFDSLSGRFLFDSTFCKRPCKYAILCGYQMWNETLLPASFWFRLGTSTLCICKKVLDLCWTESHLPWYHLQCGAVMTLSISSPNPHNRYPMAHFHGWDVGRVLWFQTVYVLPVSLQCCMWYPVILECVRKAPDCIALVTVVHMLFQFLRSEYSNFLVIITWCLGYLSHSFIEDTFKAICFAIRNLKLAAL